MVSALDRKKLIFCWLMLSWLCSDSKRMWKEADVSRRGGRVQSSQAGQGQRTDNVQRALAQCLAHGVEKDEHKVGGNAWR